MLETPRCVVQREMGQLPSGRFILQLRAPTLTLTPSHLAALSTFVRGCSCDGPQRTRVVGSAMVNAGVYSCAHDIACGSKEVASHGGVVLHHCTASRILAGKTWTCCDACSCSVNYVAFPRFICTSLPQPGFQRICCTSSSGGSRQLGCR